MTGIVAHLQGRVLVWLSDSGVEGEMKSRRKWREVFQFHVSSNIKATTSTMRIGPQASVVDGLATVADQGPWGLFYFEKSILIS